MFPSKLWDRIGAVCRTLAILAAIFGFSLTAMLSSSFAGDELWLLLTAARAPVAAPPVSAVIGPAGGQLHTGRATLVIPAGALQRDVPVRLAGSPPPADFGPQSVATSFTLTLETESVCLPLELSVSGYASASAPVPFALGDNLIDATGNAFPGDPAILPGTVQNGSLKLSIPATEGCGVADALSRATATPTTKIEAQAFSLEGYRFRESAHFRVAYPIALAGLSRDVVADILGYAEEAYELLRSMGYDFTTKIEEKVCITVTRLDEKGGDTVIPLWGGKKASYFRLAEKLCNPNTLEPLKIAIAHEFFHVVQGAAYDPRLSIAIRHSWTSGVFQWIADASSVWFESRILNSPSYVSTAFTDNLYLRYKGLELYANKASAQETGYWASGFIRYLADFGHTSMSQGDPFVRSVWENIRLQDESSMPYSDLRAVIDAVDSDSSTAGLRWTTYAEAVSSGNTQYTNWPSPARYKYYAVQNSVGSTFSDQIQPFSVQGWLYYIDSVAPNRTLFTLNVTDYNEQSSYRLYRKQAGDEKYTDIQALRYGEPYMFTASGKENYYVVVSNANTNPPYKTSSTAAVTLASGDETAYCRDVPTNSRLITSSYYNWRKWVHPDIDNYLYAELHYVDDGTLSKVIAAYCFNPPTGLLRSQTYWQDGEYMSQYIPYNDAGQKHGTARTWSAAGIPACANDYQNDYLNGRHICYYPSGQLLSTGTWTMGNMDGEWIWYDAGGIVTTRCFYNNGTEIQCQNY